VIVGLTGGVSSGKSLVAGELKRLGARIIDADEIAREVTCPGKDAYNGIVKEFGSGVLSPDGQINRKALGAIVFSDYEKLRRLNEITHPGIMREIVLRLSLFGEKYPGELLILDAPLLIEVGLHKTMDRVIVVYADEDKQIERLKKKDNLSDDEALKRIRAQIPLSKKRGYADFVIDNNGNVEETLKQVKDVYLKLKG